MLSICICDSSVQKIDLIAEAMKLKRVWGLRRDITNLRTESQCGKQLVFIVWEVGRKLYKQLPFKILTWKLHTSLCSHPLAWVFSHGKTRKGSPLLCCHETRKKRREKKVLLLKGRKGLILKIYSGLVLEFSGRLGVTMWNHDAETGAKRRKHP